MRNCLLVLASLSLLAPSLAHASALPATHVDPRLVRALETGTISPFVPQGAKVDPLAVVELRAPADDATLARIEATGAKVTRPEITTRFIPVRLTRESLERLQNDPAIARISLVPRAGRHPLDHSAELIALDNARGARPALDRLTGTGMLIGDLDTMADPFHPTFFHADAGYFDWIDVDGDGVFSPDVDAVDLDGDGAVGGDETAHVVRAETVNEFSAQVEKARSADFDPGIDWLYLDINGNGARDYGKSKGFDDSTPALGEPLFVPDDVNRNGKLDPGERVIRLGTSKLAKIRVRMDMPTKVDMTYIRGSNLSDFIVDRTHGQAFGYPDALHATAALGIAAGDVPLVGRRWVGMAPDADIVLAADIGETSLPVESAQWVYAQKPDVVLYELSLWVGVELDGSDVLSQVIDENAETTQTTHTCPTGDQAGAGKHAHLDLAASQTGMAPFTVPSNLTPKMQAIGFSFHVRGGTPTGVHLQLPDGNVVDVTNPGFDMALPNNAGNLQAIAQMTSRGTWFYEGNIFTLDPQKQPIASGNWAFSVTGDPEHASTLDAYFDDSVSGFGRGVAWADDIATDASTVAVPSVADHCIAVSAHTGHPKTPENTWYTGDEGPLEVRAYSPRGPRIDGVQKPDILAPDNPWSSLPVDMAWAYPNHRAYPYAAYGVFGGTSGSSPHVTGVGALLAQAGIRGDAARDAIRAGAFVDDKTGAVPNGTAGYGRLNAAGALGVSTGGASPTVTFAASPADAHAGSPVTLTFVAHDDDNDASALQARWDDGYDGSWDTDYAPVAARTITPASPGRYSYKVRVRDPNGHIAEAVTWITVGPAEAPSSDSGCGCRQMPLSNVGDVAVPAGLVLGLTVLARRTRRRRTHDGP